ncbi:MAG: hypothetical protein JJ901_08435 [Erythrobacter sp.]|uniref:hypothetical protein n=1 Tax=Erythrobacter sp. TaxID=1042 RepID=UPI001AFD3FB8|nr:hypothetical protein [Erythrobacter sp.]MBO6768315.1 hypothetical protein [Erythrobacter sp.]
MSRVSFNRRLEAVLAAAERVNPQAAAVYRLPPALRQRYDAWRTQCDAVQSQYGEGGALYAAMLSGELVTPDPPRTVAEALGLNASPIVTDAMTLQQVADLYASMIE